ncbi:ABC transporter substrate-binding protein [Rothia sp. AR01]|uniref:ABC transporter substrate-binding protein n=1 Tax=Rothia santali TaxID=2949643 RepID=A0A9X2HGR5_9MICC|nr:ABC transporter substrate-binding protein [Rothia santali]MCP3424548.1 ABC transporter substrate-binding protein [Rothia santali]
MTREHQTPAEHRPASPRPRPTPPGRLLEAPRPRLRGRATALTAALSLGALVLAGCGGAEAQGEPASDSGQSGSADSQTVAGMELPESWQHVAGEVDFEGIEAEPQLPATVTDGTGTEVTVHDTSKIISAGDGVSSTLAALGLADSIYAAPGNGTDPASVAAPEHFEFSKQTGTEGLLALDGTLFIGDNTKRHGDVAQQFRDAGTDAVVLDDQQTQAEKLQAVADYVGAHEAGEQLVDSLESDMDEAKRTVEDADLTGHRVIQVTANGAGGQNSVAGTGTPGTEMVEALGMTSVGSESGLRGFSREFSSEGILAANPDVILMAESDFEKWGGEDGFWEAFPTLRDTPAGQDAKIIVMPDAQLRYSSPELGAGAQALAQKLAES